MKNGRETDLLLGYVEYTGSWAYDPPSTFQTQLESIVGYAEYTQPSNRASDRLLGYAEYTQPSKRESDLLLGYVEYIGTTSFSEPNASQYQFDAILTYIEHVQPLKVETEMLLGYIEVDYFSFEPPPPIPPILYGFGPLVQIS